ncbi:7454_t:CDS:2 [Entrophospora sp. SA101]|nr:7454_t:CDS:2 [Entrophospora sp. SA101]
MVLNINDENDDDNNEIITNKKPTTTNNISNEIDQQDQERFSSSNLSNPLLIPKPSLVETLKYHLLIRLFDQPKNLDEFVISFVQTSTTSTVNNNLKNTYSKRGNVEIINLKKTRKSSSIEIPSSSDSINNNHDAELGRSSWKLLHTMMARFPEHPTEDHKQALRSFIYLFGRLYPCGECATEFQEILSKYPPQVSSREAASQWACAVHNIVNKRLYKKIFDCGLIAEKYKCGCDDDGGDGEIMK